MANKLMKLPENRLFNNSNIAVPGGTASLYLSGTTTPVAFLASDGVTSLGSTVTANGIGQLPDAYGDESVAYRLILKDTLGAELDGGDIDPFYFGGGAANTTGGQTLSAAATPMDFGAVGDGITDDTAALKAALESGKVIDGLGLTYALGSPVTPVAINRFKNANLKWATTDAMTAQQPMLHLNGLSNWTVDSVDFDFGTVQNTGSENDSGRRCLLVENTSGGYCSRVVVRNCTGHGSGNGTVFDIRDTRGAKILDNTVHDRVMIMGDAGKPDNDAMDGFVIQNGWDMIFMGNHVRDNTTSADGGTTYTNNFNRGVAIVGLQNSIIANNHMSLVGQGFDFSGNLTINGGNRGLTIVGNTGSYCYYWAFKFVHGIKDCEIVACLARYTGTCGFVFDSDAGYSATDKTQRLNLANCKSLQAWANGQGTEADGNTWCGFRIEAEDTTNGVANCTFDNCTVYEDGNHMIYGFRSDETTDTTSNLYRDCKVVSEGTSTHSLGDHNSGIAASSWKTM